MELPDVNSGGGRNRPLVYNTYSGQWLPYHGAPLDLNQPIGRIDPQRLSRGTTPSSRHPPPSAPPPIPRHHFDASSIREPSRPHHPVTVERHARRRSTAGDYSSDRRRDRVPVGEIPLRAPAPRVVERYEELPHERHFRPRATGKVHHHEEEYQRVYEAREIPYRTPPPPPPVAPLNDLHHKESPFPLHAGARMSNYDVQQDEPPSVRPTMERSTHQQRRPGGEPAEQRDKYRRWFDPPFYHAPPLARTSSFEDLHIDHGVSSLPRGRMHDEQQDERPRRPNPERETHWRGSDVSEEIPRHRGRHDRRWEDEELERDPPPRQATASPLPRPPVPFPVSPPVVPTPPPPVPSPPPDDLYRGEYGRSHQQHESFATRGSGVRPTQQNKPATAVDGVDAWAEDQLRHAFQKTYEGSGEPQPTHHRKTGHGSDSRRERTAHRGAKSPSSSSNTESEKIGKVREKTRTRGHHHRRVPEKERARPEEEDPEEERRRPKNEKERGRPREDPERDRRRPREEPEKDRRRPREGPERDKRRPREDPEKKHRKKHSEAQEDAHRTQHRKPYVERGPWTSDSAVEQTEDTDPEKDKKRPREDRERDRRRPRDPEKKNRRKHSEAREDAHRTQPQHREPFIERRPWETPDPVVDQTKDTLPVREQAKKSRKKPSSKATASRRPTTFEPVPPPPEKPEPIDPSVRLEEIAKRYGWWNDTFWKTRVKEFEKIAHSDKAEDKKKRAELLNPFDTRIRLRLVERKKGGGSPDEINEIKEQQQFVKALIAECT